MHLIDMFTTIFRDDDGVTKILQAYSEKLHKYDLI